MNPSHESKEWPMAQASEGSVTAAAATHAMQHYSPIPSMGHSYGSHSFTQGAPLHPPIHTYPSMAPGYLPSNRVESDPRLPGMMALSQPGTPRPNATNHDAPPSPTKNARSAYTTSSFHAGPYSPISLTRKRSRNDSLCPTEAGPVFSSTKHFDNLYALDRTTLLMPRIQAKMDRGFFLFYNDWTCYRRNYFQVSGVFSIQGTSHYYSENDPQCLVQKEDGTFRQCQRFFLGISARVSNSDKEIELIQHTPKRDKGPQIKPEPKPITLGGNLGMSTVGSNQNIATFERIQFKTATANNGKRRAAQQYYVCLVNLYALTEDGQKVKIASCQSAPLVVRGRSPGHYADSQDRHGTAQPTHENGQLSSPSSIDERFTTPYARPPMTSPSMMSAEYNSSYPYYTNYSHFASPLPHTMMVGIAPTATSHTTTHPPYPHPHPSQASHPYMVHTVPDHPSETPSSDMYSSDYVSHQSIGHEEPKMTHLHHPSHPTNNLNIHIPLDSAPAEWTRTRYHSTSSLQSSPAQDHAQNSYFPHGTPTLSSATSQTSAFSPTTPTTPYGPRKYNAVPNLVNQQSS
ncbi:hypothetical protein BDF14DRAFT_1821163 [Spinellus fusiger]|nr:hypothetical protein BDF14DRAFT_1821163 [Spinellus fusiger]